MRVPRREVPQHLPNKRLGVHTHNNLQLAFANTLTAADNGRGAAWTLPCTAWAAQQATAPTELLVAQADESEVQLASGTRHDREAYDSASREGRVGLHHPVYDHGHAGRASAFGDGASAKSATRTAVDFYDKMTTPEVLPQASNRRAIDSSRTTRTGAFAYWKATRRRFAIIVRYSTAHVFIVFRYFALCS